jgi:hypothetical protein
MAERVVTSTQRIKQTGRVRCPAQRHHDRLDALARLRCALEPWEVKNIENPFRCDALDAVASGLPFDLLHNVRPRIRWFDGRCLSTIHNQAAGL